MELLRGLNNKNGFGMLPDEVELYTLFKNRVSPACFAPEELRSLGNAMARIQLRGSSALAGYTYLGQFLAHDLSRLRIGGHDKTVKSFDTEILRSNVSAVLDLGCVYNGATKNSRMRVEESAYMRLGAAECADGSLLCGYDLPRNKQGIAYIGDDRNDENLLVAQLHVQFLWLHNFFVDVIKAEQPLLDTEALFISAKTQVVLHYHQVILYDFLSEILHPSVWKAIILKDRSILWTPTTETPAVLPIEYAAAAGRFGHSMVHERYFLNSPYEAVGLDALFTMTGHGRFGGGLTRLPASHVVDWLRFFNFPCVDRVARPGKNKAKRISPQVKIVLVNIESLPKPKYVNLAERNLLRGLQMKLCSGQAAVNDLLENFSQQLDEYEIPIRQLTADELNLNSPNNPRGVLDGCCSTLTDNTPLWFYLLAEASLDGNGKLGPLGSLIMAETVKGILKLDGASVLNLPISRQYIKPTKEIAGVPGHYLQMSDLILAATPGLPNPTELYEK